MQWPMSFLLASHGGYNDCWFMEKWGPSNGIYSLSYWLDIFTFLLYQHKNFIWTVFNIFHFRNFVRTSVETDCVKYEEFLASSLFTFQHLWCSSAPCAVWKECLCLCSFFHCRIPSQSCFWLCKALFFNAVSNQNKRAAHLIRYTNSTAKHAGAAAFMQVAIFQKSLTMVTNTHFSDFESGLLRLCSPNGICC